MKKTITAVALSSICTASFAAETVEGKIACRSEKWYDDFFEMMAAGDSASAKAYVEDLKCFPLKDGIKVTIHESPGFGFGPWEVSVKGVRLFVQYEGISVQ